MDLVGLHVNAPVGTPQVYCFGVFELDTRAHELYRQARRVRLQVQPYQVLLMLVERAGTVVTREDLRQALWPSSVYVDFDHGLNNAIGRLREALGDAAATPAFIETLPRVGYRFIYPVTRKVVSGGTAVQQVAAESPPGVTRAESVPTDTTLAVLDAVPPAEIRQQQTSRWFNRRRVGIVPAGVALLALLAALWPSQRSAEEVTVASALPSEPSLAVLPFVNMSPELENEYFTDGLTEELVSKLAAIKGLKVAAQISSSRFKGKPDAPAVIAMELNVNHLLEGSVRRSGNRVRINAQLIDARDGYHRWSETFDRELTDIFGIQEEIAIAVTNALRLKLVAATGENVSEARQSRPAALKQS